MDIGVNIMAKTEELFSRWFTDNEVCDSHREILRVLCETRATSLCSQDFRRALCPLRSGALSSGELPSFPLVSMETAPLSGTCLRAQGTSEVLSATQGSKITSTTASACSANHYRHFPVSSTTPRSFTPPSKPQRQKVKSAKSVEEYSKTIPFLRIIQEKSALDSDGEIVDRPIITDPKNLQKPTNRTQIPKPFDQIPPKPVEIPKFYFPRGKPKSNDEIVQLMEEMNRKLKEIEAPNTQNQNSIHKTKMGEVARILNIPLYWKQLIYMYAGGDETNMCITRESVISMWERIITNNYNEASQFFALVTQEKKTYVEPQDFYPLVQDVLETHPGLTFLLSARDFHSRYIATVVYRIFFDINSSWSMKVTLHELEKSDLLHILRSLENTDDINTITQYFSYEHFYVIYCKFWELDEDHDLVISKADLARHNNYAISERLIERIFSGSVTKSRARSEGLMTYTEFVWFLLAEEDKRHPRSVEYWFRCMDLDGDGVLSLYELDYFYQEQLFRMEEMGIEPISFEDCICQMLDMIKPKVQNKIRLSDLKNCRLVSIFFDTFFNLTKYLEHEQKDPFTNLKDLEDGLNNISDWDRYAAEAYEILVAEDGSQDNFNDNYRECGQVYKNSVDSQNEDAVYENINTKQATSGKKPEMIYESTRYNDFVNGKLSDISDSPSSTSQTIAGKN